MIWIYSLFDDMAFWRENGFKREPSKTPVSEQIIQHEPDHVDGIVMVALLCDTNHVLSSDYSEVAIVGAGADAVDFKLISLCHQGDIVVTQDYGVAAMALGKKAYAIHQSG